MAMPPVKWSKMTAVCMHAVFPLAHTTIGSASWPAISTNHHSKDSAASSTAPAPLIMNCRRRACRPAQTQARQPTTNLFPASHRRAPQRQARHGSDYFQFAQHGYRATIWLSADSEFLADRTQLRCRSLTPGQHGAWPTAANDARFPHVSSHVWQPYSTRSRKDYVV